MTHIKKITPWLKDYFRRADMLLLVLCIICAVFGLVVIWSATLTYETTRYVVVQTAAVLLGIALYMIMTVLDLELLADKWILLTVFNVCFLGLLLFFGDQSETGNNGWLRFLGIGIQPSEIVKVVYIVVLAKHITYLKDYKGLDSVVSVAQLVLHFGGMFAILMLTSRDLGSALVFFFIFAVMLFAAGLKLYWFAIGFAAIAAAVPLAWEYVLADYQKARILAPYVEDLSKFVDSSSVNLTDYGVYWQANQSKIALASGRLTGTGLGEGVQSQSNAIFAKQSDFIFAVLGEELGMIGCTVAILLLAAIVVRCVVIGLRSKNRMSMLVCTGVAAMVVFQTLENVGMCIGIAPVVGITLPFFSYGGSSVVAMFGAMGLVSGAKYRPKPARFNLYK